MIFSFFFRVEQLARGQAVLKAFTSTFCQNTRDGKIRAISNGMVGAGGFPGQKIISVEVKNQ